MDKERILDALTASTLEHWTAPIPGKGVTHLKMHQINRRAAFPTKFVDDVPTMMDVDGHRFYFEYNANFPLYERYAVFVIPPETYGHLSIDIFSYEKLQHFVSVIADHRFSVVSESRDKTLELSSSYVALSGTPDDGSRDHLVLFTPVEHAAKVTRLFYDLHMSIIMSTDNVQTEFLTSEELLARTDLMAQVGTDSPLVLLKDGWLSIPNSVEELGREEAGLYEVQHGADLAVTDFPLQYTNIITLKGEQHYMFHVPRAKNPEGYLLHPGLAELYLCQPSERSVDKANNVSRELRNHIYMITHSDFVVRKSALDKIIADKNIKGFARFVHVADTKLYPKILDDNPYQLLEFLDQFATDEEVIAGLLAAENRDFVEAMFDGVYMREISKILPDIASWSSMDFFIKFYGIMNILTILANNYVEFTWPTDTFAVPLMFVDTNATFVASINGQLLYPEEYQVVVNDETLEATFSPNLSAALTPSAGDRISIEMFDMDDGNVTLVSPRPSRIVYDKPRTIPRVSEDYVLSIYREGVWHDVTGEIPTYLEHQDINEVPYIVFNEEHDASMFAVAFNSGGAYLSQTLGSGDQTIQLSEKATDLLPDELYVREIKHETHRPVVLGYVVRAPYAGTTWDGGSGDVVLDWNNRYNANLLLSDAPFPEANIECGCNVTNDDALLIDIGELTYGNTFRMGILEIDYGDEVVEESSEIQTFAYLTNAENAELIKRSRFADEDYPEAIELSPRYAANMITSIMVNDTLHELDWESSVNNKITIPLYDEYHATERLLLRFPMAAGATKRLVQLRIKMVNVNDDYPALQDGVVPMVGAINTMVFVDRVRLTPEYDYRVLNGNIVFADRWLALHPMDGSERLEVYAYRDVNISEEITAPNKNITSGLRFRKSTQTIADVVPVGEDYALLIDPEYREVETYVRSYARTQGAFRILDATSTGCVFPPWFTKYVVAILYRDGLMLEDIRLRITHTGRGRAKRGNIELHWVDGTIDKVPMLVGKDALAAPDIQDFGSAEMPDLSKPLQWIILSVEGLEPEDTVKVYECSVNRKSNIVFTNGNLLREKSITRGYEDKLSLVASKTKITGTNPIYDTEPYVSLSRGINVLDGLVQPRSMLPTGSTVTYHRRTGLDIAAFNFTEELLRFGNLPTYTEIITN